MILQVFNKGLLSDSERNPTRKRGNINWFYFEICRKCKMPSSAGGKEIDYFLP